MYGICLSLSDLLHLVWGSPDSSVGKESACNAGDPVQSLGQEGPLEEGIATQSSVLAWEVPWTEEPGVLGPQGLWPLLVAVVTVAARGPEPCRQSPLMLLGSLGLWLSSSGITGPAPTVPPALTPLGVPVPPHLHLQMCAISGVRVRCTEAPLSSCGCFVGCRWMEEERPRECLMPPRCSH